MNFPFAVVISLHHSLLRNKLNFLNVFAKGHKVAFYSEKY